jgi:hypothetical protein
MGKVRELALRLKNLNFRQLVVETLIENEEHIVDLNTQQLFQGERADGTVLPDYSWVSVNFYNKPEGPIRLYDTGDFYGGFKLGSKSGKAEFPLYIISTDKKSNELQTKYGNEIFGLNEENMRGLVQVFILPSIGKKLRGIIQLR